MEWQEDHTLFEELHSGCEEEPMQIQACLKRQGVLCHKEALWQLQICLICQCYCSEQADGLADSRYPAYDSIL